MITTRPNNNNNKIKFEYLTEHRGVKVILTNHARQQAYQRHGLPIESMKLWFTQAIDKIRQTGFEPEYYNQEVFVYNRHYQRGMVVAFRRDNRNVESDKLCLVAVTCYPYGKSFPAHRDTKTIRV